MSKKRKERRDEPLDIRREHFAAAVAHLLDMAEAVVSGRADTDELRALDPYDRGIKNRERLEQAAYGYAGLSQQAFVVTRADVERGALAMLGDQEAFELRNAQYDDDE